MPENSVDSIVTDPPAGISFMNKEWDDDKGGRDQWIAWLAEVMREALRVLKPGGHALVWSLPRTSHWTGQALEDAGFEVRDVISHLFGTGFPKSLDISKAIDKALGRESERPVSHPNPSKRPNAYIGDNGWVTPQRPEFKTSAATPEAKQWQGFGTALKPACEMWWLVRKPISEKTVAANVLKWGTGGLNIDGCRITYKSDADFESAKGGDTGSSNRAMDGWGLNTAIPQSQKITLKGRFPANLILDETAAEMLGEPSRFFYVAKASAREKNAGLDTEPVNVNDGRATAIDNPFQRGETLRKNTHPTVKSIALMEYLVKLVTPPGGTVIDPFMGSGSTGVAAQNLGFNFIGMEHEAEYHGIAVSRIENATPRCYL